MSDSGRSPQQVSVPAWLVSWPVIILSTVLFCGAGLVLLWLRPTTSKMTKALVTALVVAAVALVGVTALNSPSPSTLAVSPDSSLSSPSMPSTSADGSPLPEWAQVQLTDNEYLADLNPFVATVVGYGDPDSFTNQDDIRWIQLSWTRQWIDGYGDDEEVTSEPAAGAVKLDMVMPFEPEACNAKDPDAARKAREALERILPVGSTVLAIRAGTQSRDLDRFLHVLASPTSAPSPAPPAGSVNEALVATGTWVPDDNPYYYDDRPYDASSVLIVGPKFRAPQPITAYDPEKPYFEEGDYGRAYSDRIIAAANTALTSTAEGEACRTAYTAYVKREVKEAKENDRETDAWLLKMERERQSSTCRDGDGDGICFER